MIDLLCDKELQGLYEEAGMSKSRGMSVRNYQNQKGGSTVE